MENKICLHKNKYKYKTAYMQEHRFGPVMQQWPSKQQYCTAETSTGDVQECCVQSNNTLSIKEKNHSQSTILQLAKQVQVLVGHKVCTHASTA